MWLYRPHVLSKKPRCLAGLQHFTCVQGYAMVGAETPEFSGSSVVQGLVTEQNI